jgi:hypothetical protein
MLETLHARLAIMNQGRLLPRLATACWRERLAAEHAVRILECEVVELERARSARRAAEAPREPAAFVAWFEQLAHDGPGQGDPLFPWLAERATGAQMKWFLHQEVAGEAGFEDLVALTQVRLAERPKLELARNYWDEMGRGNAGGMHGPMLSRLADALELAALAVPIVWEAHALGNVMLALATNRHYAYQSLGALGVIEQTAPGRAACVDAGLKRLNLAPAARHYFALHATLDLKHSAAWNAEVLRPVVAADPRTAKAIAEGALLRLEAGRRCFERYRAELRVGQSQPSFASSASPVADRAAPMSVR